MLTDFQLAVLLQFSAGIVYGTVVGACSAALTGGLIRSMRTHSPGAVVTGAIHALLPGVACAVAVSVGISAIFVSVFDHIGGKEVWGVPRSLEFPTVLLKVALPPVAGAFGALLALQQQVRPLRPIVLAGLSVAGAILGALGNVRGGFDGYYCLNSNIRPLAYATTGFIVAGLGVPLWCLAVYGVRSAARPNQSLDQTADSVQRNG